MKDIGVELILPDITFLLNKWTIQGGCKAFGKKIHECSLSGVRKEKKQGQIEMASEWL